MFGVQIVCTGLSWPGSILFAPSKKDSEMASSPIARRSMLAAAGALFGSPVFALAPSAKPKVAIQTGKGVILLELELGKAPITAANFLRYVDAGRFDGAVFYRASRAAGAPTVGLIEGGLADDQARFDPVPHESTLMTGLAHKDGTISMGREAPGTATADFFICSGPASYLDANPKAAGDNDGYAAFGSVIEGMDVVRAILALPTTGLARTPSMQGQILDPPVTIVSMRRMA
jgi:peptidyl-prolyl cis-trans isomerase A (cyclophilin A)